MAAITSQPRLAAALQQRAPRMSAVLCKATKAVAKSAAKRQAAPAKVEKNSLSILAAVERLQILSQVEKAGLLSKAEKAGFSLSKIEEAGLLSFAESSGILSLIADEGTPGLLSAIGFAALGAAGALVYAVPDDSTGLVAAQAIGALLLGGAGGASLFGGATLAKFQKL